jgi:hypothetical protein
MLADEGASQPLSSAFICVISAFWSVICLLNAMAVANCRS